VEPGVEAIRVAQAAQVEPGLEEGILYRVGRVLVVTEDPARLRLI
jgi:hypothetical protein